MRPIIFHPKARDAIRRFPKVTRVSLGRGLFRLQMGQQLVTPNSRPIARSRCRSLRTARKEDRIFRTFYYVASKQAILVFHAFVKKTQRTPPLEIELARKRLKEVLDA